MWSRTEQRGRLILLVHLQRLLSFLVLTRVRYFWRLGNEQVPETSTGLNKLRNRLRMYRAFKFFVKICEPVRQILRSSMPTSLGRPQPAFYQDGFTDLLRPDSLHPLLLLSATPLFEHPKLRVPPVSPMAPGPARVLEAIPLERIVLRVFFRQLRQRIGRQAYIVTGRQIDSPPSLYPHLGAGRSRCRVDIQISSIRSVDVYERISVR